MLNKPTLTVLALVTLLAGTVFLVLPDRTEAHCQVPCGIYDDPAKIAELKQHALTVDKAMAQINELAGKTDAQSLQQVARWVANKESHADKIQHEAQAYFLAQRIKFPADEAGADAYHAKLASLHQIIVYAMKCKQTVDPANSAKLSEAIATFESQYFDKGALHHDHAHDDAHAAAHGHDHAHGHSH